MLKNEGYMTSEVLYQKQKPLYEPPVALSPFRENYLETEIKLLEI